MADLKPEIDTPSIGKDELELKLKANADERKQLRLLQSQMKVAELEEAQLKRTQVIQAAPKPVPVVENMPTAPQDVDWTKSKDVKLPTLAPAPLEVVETAQQKRNRNFVTGFSQAQGMPKISFVNLESGRKPGNPNS